ncbi:hypothetical protein ACQPYK_36515 [Streptosporangium sp. CA-135522]|uniref:hypothetical protein n=1 Tax=Streptosporangium sp. CA-135522 TaxID=3240072 RepID=UPI003D8D3E98
MLVATWLPGSLRALIAAILSIFVSSINLGGAVQLKMINLVDVSARTWWTAILSYPYSAAMLGAWLWLVERLPNALSWHRNSITLAVVAVIGVSLDFGFSVKIRNPHLGPNAELSLRNAPKTVLFAAFALVFVHLWSGNTISSVSGWLWGSAALGATVLTSFLLRLPARRMTSLSEADSIRTREQRDARANLIKQAVVDDGSPEPFNLYLRSFAITDRFLVQSPYAVEWNRIQWHPHLDFETVLYRATANRHPTIALGPPSEGLGIPRIEEQSDDHWRDLFARLASAAEHIIMIPSASRWVQWEMNWLRANHRLNRTIFVMPEFPHVPSKGIVEAPSFQGFPEELSDPKKARWLDPREEWAKARSASKAQGFSLPAYSDAGALFTLGPRGTTARTLGPLNLIDSARRVRRLRRLLEKMTEEPD